MFCTEPQSRGKEGETEKLLLSLSSPLSVLKTSSIGAVECKGMLSRRERERESIVKCTDGIGR
jgi:hypothetical protein